MARFLEIDNFGTAGGSYTAGFYLINIDRITAIHPDSSTQVWITYQGQAFSAASGATQYIQLDFDPANTYSNLNDSMTAWIVNAIQSTSNSINAVIRLKDFLPEGVTITGITFAN
jgi:predicted cupin superfamily sugar epimerase